MLFIGQSAGNVRLPIPIIPKISTNSNSQIIGPHLYTTAEKPLYRRGLISNLCLFIILIILIVLATLYLMFLNRKHANRREALGKSAIVADRSMMNAQERLADEQNNAGDEVEGGEKAFDDITDLQNEDFVFVY